VAERPAVNASPLIFLASGGLLHLLKIAGNEVVVPAAVADEIQRRGPDDPTVRAIDKTSWLVVVPTPPVHELIQSWDLGPGEPDLDKQN
jgi:predicted nucleic acid-binding protein